MPPSIKTFALGNFLEMESSQNVDLVDQMSRCHQKVGEFNKAEVLALQVLLDSRVALNEGRLREDMSDKVNDMLLPGQQMTGDGCLADEDSDCNGREESKD